MYLFIQTYTSRNQPQPSHIVSNTFPFNFLEWTRDIGQIHATSCGCLLDADVCLIYSLQYNLVAAVSNTLQAVNFSVNFVLYYAINAHFRRAIGSLLRCRCVSVCDTSEVRRDGGGHNKHSASGSLTLQVYSLSSRTTGRGSGEGGEGLMTLNKVKNVKVHHGSSVPI